MVSRKTPGEGLSVSRRKLLGSAVSAGSVILIPLTSCTTQVSTPSPSVMSSESRQLLEAFVDRIIPADESSPGAVAAGVSYYIDHSLANWNSHETGTLVAGLLELNQTARRRYDRDFQQLPNADKDALLRDMEDGVIEGFDSAPQIFDRLHRLTLEGMFSDPYYGGNRNYAGWDLIGYPGAVMASTADMQRMGGRLPLLHTSAYGSDYDGD